MFVTVMRLDVHHGVIHMNHMHIFQMEKGYTIALYTGPDMPECERIVSSIKFLRVINM